MTIGNLENQVRNLVARCEGLVRDSQNWQSIIAKRDDILADCRNQLEASQVNFETERQFRRSDISRLEECQAKLASVEQRFEGYRMHVRDTSWPLDIRETK